ncbi:hypothetical protein MANES_10G111201v8 [Manihot esculenta]|uniref:Uncharacterized protein n=1 Tax=Manihot esculenta TaxID=3983 RepID=A0ACB7H0D6_MANES|nr:hypothetical protein MANES_10G111201v8 [Manihot esculenta]
MKLLFLVLILGGSISCSIGVELESLPYREGRKQEIACQLAGKANIRTTASFLACGDVKINQKKAKENLRKYETLQPSASQQIVVLRYNQIIMRRLLAKGPSTGKGPDPCSHVVGSVSCTGGHG